MFFYIKTNRQNHTKRVDAISTGNRFSLLEICKKNKINKAAHTVGSHF